MVVRLKCGKNIRGAVSYNEAKVRKGEAELIMAWRFGCNADELSFPEKLRRFTLLNEKCVTSAYNTVHISLNFSPEDKLDTEKLQQVARDYMQLLGFEKQPYLVYRHDDTSHPHIHIVTTPVKPNGKTLSLHNLVQRKSEPARKELEKRYGLTVAEGRKLAECLQPVDIERVEYGKTETKSAISQIVRHVADNYRYTSFEEYNLVLKQFGITADIGAAGSKQRTHGGLTYSLIDRNGNKTGVPVKASSIYTSPTLARIEKRLARNSVRKQATLRYTKARVSYAIKHAKDQGSLVRALQASQIILVNDSEHRPVFIDHRNRTVCSADELGVSLELAEQQLPFQLAGSGLMEDLLQKLLEENWTGAEVSGQFFKRKRKKKK